jgi:hypothetical protein
MDGHKFSDKTTVTNLRVFKQGFTSTQEVEAALGQWSIFRTMGSNQIQLNGKGNQNGNLEVSIYTLSGQLIANKILSVQTGTNQLTLETEPQSAGIYIITLSQNGKLQSKKVYLP